MTRRVLLVDDDREVREALGQTLELADLDPVLAGSFIEAKDHMDSRFDGIVVTDIRMPGRDGFHLLDHARKLDADLPVILLTGEGDIPMAVEAMGRGAFDFLEKPCAPKDLVATVERALKARGEVLEARRQKLQLESGDAAARMIFGVSRLSEEMRQRLRAVAKSSAEVLVTGEVGSGTFKLAEVIHLLSASARYPFVKRAAAGLAPEALEEALDAASPGTLYLDEVAALPPATQFVLLDRLESGCPTRVVAGTTRDIEGEVAEGRFSADLFYRLDLMRVRIPSLRERPEDIPEMFRRYVAQACEQANLPMPEIPQELMGRLMAQDWPGNTRALMNYAMRYVMGLADGEDEAELGLSEQLARVEKSLLAEALRKTQGQASEAARLLKLPRKTFYDKLGRHGLRPEAYRGADDG